MVDPLGHQTLQSSPAELKGQRNFALHPATSARVRDIHRASVHQRFRYQGINFRNVRADTAVRPYAENLVSAAQAIFVTTTHHIRAGTEACPYEWLH